jgi:hypothetical protein
VIEHPEISTAVLGYVIGTGLVLDRLYWWWRRRRAVRTLRWVCKAGAGGLPDMLLQPEHIAFLLAELTKHRALNLAERDQ